ncbi:MAG: hydrolase [Epsilonproteobacteria bacterium]|nr:hydrolase [Campylobacterota bacterium]NPA88878.1 carbon-nitrogen hydrolase family protein [Campylobacterota bacterium]
MDSSTPPKKWKIEIVPLRTTPDYSQNLQNLITATNTSPADFLLFPEVVLTGFDYHNWKEVNRFGEFALEQLKKEITKPIALTIILDNRNYFFLLAPGEEIYRRGKWNLFGYEKKHFQPGRPPEIFQWGELKLLPLICFELRFVEYWLQFRNKVDLILVPARWGKERISHFQTLLKGVALSTQTWVAGVNSPNETSYSALWNGWGEGIDSTQSFISGVDLTLNSYYRKKLPLQ